MNVCGFFRFVVLAVALSASTARGAERRVALLVGASAYRAVPSLRNTLNDARGMATSLKRLDFDVDLVLDPDRAHFEAAVRRFGERALGADLAFFYYSGHALEANGRNWLLPISADPRSGRDLRFEAIELNDILEQLDGAARLSIIILDACRDNPFRMRLGESARGLDHGGLAQVQAAAGTLVVFSTSPGNVAADGAGANSPFTGALLKHIEAPGEEIRQVLADVRREVREATNGQQIPWEQSAMEGALFLKPGAAPTTGRSDAEALFWDSVRNTTDPAELNAYLARYPSGIFADLARARLAAFARPAESAFERLVRAMPAVSASERQQLVTDYLAAGDAKALAISIETGDADWSASWSDGSRAMETALEGCQVRTGKPCAPFAVGTELTPHSAVGDWPRRDMPRVHYAGLYDPAQIPRLRDSTRLGAVVTGYRAAVEPKAMALHPRGNVFAATGAASEQAAQDQALSTCNADPERNGQGGPCFLYAAGDQVVLPQRLIRPLQKADVTGVTDLAAKAKFSARLIAAVAFLSPQARDQVVNDYSSSPLNRAIAALPGPGGRILRSSGFSTPADAETVVLERCEWAFVACELIASNDRIVLDGPKRRLMPRMNYVGQFDPAHIPIVSDMTRSSAPVLTYAKSPGAKAVALHETGVLAIITGETDQNAAEQNALARCNADTKDQPSYCQLYAVGNEVVLEHHQIKPITRAR